MSINVLLLIISILLLFYYCYFLLKVSEGIKKVKNKTIDNAPFDLVTVIIPFRNEENNIINSLNSLKNQNFPKEKLEILYIDDDSDDNSYKLLSAQIKEKNIEVFKAPKTKDERAHKKQALSFAISKARGDIIITTDADCVHGENWILEMVKCFSKNTAFVSGPVEFTSNDTLFHNLQKMEFAGLILTGAGLIGNKTPIICNAANLGFRKAVFNEVGGYADNMNLSSGDDEFLMQKISSETNYDIVFCFNKDAMCYTKPNNTIFEFYNQRKRWASKGFYYVKKSTVLTLILIFLFYLFLPIQLILAIFVHKIFFISLFVSLILKAIIEFKIVIVDSKTLFGKFKLHHFLIAQLVHIPYIIISGLAGILGNYKWKDREIKR